MSNPIIFNRGVKYIKLAKFDTGSASENLTTQLGEVNTIRVNYSDKGIVEYPISSITEHETYYLYRVATTDATSSADNKQLDYYFTASSVLADYAPPSSNETINIVQYNSPLSDTLQYFNASSGKYTYGDTPNTPITASISCSLLLSSGNVNDQYGFNLLLQKIDNIGNTSTIANAGSNTVTGTATPSSSLDFSFTPIEGEQYFVGINSAYLGSGDPEFSINVSFLLITSSAYTTSTGTQIPVILEPFFSEPFYNGDYDVLVNNTPNARRSNLFFDVDYSDNIIQAVNQQVLISSSQQGRLGAPYARIQDYNYYIDRSLTPRYKGSKSTSPGFNLSSSEGGFGKLPNVEQLNVAAYSINWAGGTSPEILGAGGTSLSDILLVGDNRDDITIIPQADPNYSDTINSSVEPGDIVSFYQYGNSSAQAPQRVEVIETKVNVPPKSAYMISSQDTDDLAEWTASFFDGNGGIKFAGNPVGVYKVNTNDSGFYITGSFITASDFIPEFQERFNNSENDWYVSLYTKLPSPVIYNGSNATTNFEFTSNFTTSDPLGYYGVSKIIGVKTAGGGTAAGIYLDRNIGVDNGDQIGTLYGILIWESWGNSIIVRGSNLSGVGASLVYSEFAPKALTNNLDYISRTYTNKS